MRRRWLVSVIELVAEAGDQVQEGRLSAGDLRRAAEVLITSTAGGIMLVTVVDGQPAGTGAPDPGRPRCGSGTGPATRTPGSLLRSGTTAKGDRRPKHRTQAITHSDEREPRRTRSEPPICTAAVIAWSLATGRANDLPRRSLRR